MKRKTSIILVLISLVVMSAAYYLFRYVVRDRSFEATALASLFTILAIFVLYIAYRELLRHFGKGAPVKEDYATLYGLEKPRVTGEVEFYFSINAPRQISFVILSGDLQELQVLADREFAKGGHIIRFDTSALQNGIYFYCLRSDNQKTMKRMLVQHDNLAV
jgi:hypothetical protein